MIERRRRIAAPAAEIWTAITDPACWPEWGPTVTSAELDGPFVAGATGRVRTPIGIWLPFELRDVTPGRSWSWRVAGIPATTHRVEAIDETTTEVTFGVPTLGAPYVLVVDLGLRRLADLVEAGAPTNV